jgi:hypothetical protein
VKERWLHRFQNFELALLQLERAVELSRHRELSELERQGLVHVFEFTHELAWNVMKDFLEESGQSGIYGSRDATQGVRRFTLSRADVKSVQAEFPNLGFHKNLVRLAWGQFMRHPLNPLPMMKW